MAALRAVSHCCSCRLQRRRFSFGSFHDSTLRKKGRGQHGSDPATPHDRVIENVRRNTKTDGKAQSPVFNPLRLLASLLTKTDASSAAALQLTGWDWFKKVSGHVAVTWRNAFIWVAGFSCAVGAVLYVFLDPLKEDTVEQTANVTTQVISLPGVKDEALGLSRSVVSGILQDDKSLELVSHLVHRLARHPGTLKIFAGLLRDLYCDPRNEKAVRLWVSSLANDQGTIDIVADMAKEVLFRLLRDPASKEQGITYLATVLQHVLLSEKLQDAAIEACVGVSGRVAGLQTFQDPTVVSLNKLTLDNVKLSTALAINRSKLNALQKQYEVKVKREAYEARYNEKLAGRLQQAAT